MIPTSKNKVALLSAFYEPFMSGAEQMVKEIAEKLGNNYEITIITGKFDKSLPDKENKGNFSLIRVGIGHKQLDKILYPLLAAWQVRRLRPQITHAIMESFAGGALALVKYFYPSTKRILTLQSGDLDSDLKQKQLLLKIFWKAIHRSPDKITAISSFLALRAKKLGVAADKISIIPNGVDLSAVPRDLEVINNRVVCVARLSWEKGLNYLILAWPEVLRVVPEAKLVLVGEGNKRQEIERMIKDSGLSESVELLGNLAHTKVLEEITKSQIFICPSLAEGLGIVFIEAQACGIPTIGTRVGGISDVIKDEDNGLLISPKSSTEISEAILKLLKDKDLRERLSKNAIETVKKFDWQRIINEIDDVYKSYLRPIRGRVLLATGIYPPQIGGPATFAYYLSKGLAQSGYKVDILTFSDKDGSKNDNGIRIGYLSNKKNSLIRYFSYWLSLLKMSFQSDVIYAFDITSVGIPAAFVKLVRGRGIGLVYRLGGDFQWERAISKNNFTGTLRQYYERKKFNFKEKVIYYLTNFALKRADWIIYNANFIKDIYEKNRLINKNSSVIRNIRFKNDLTQLPLSEKRPLNEGKTNLIYAGRFAKVKNLSNLLRAVKLIKDDRPEIARKISLVLIGEGPEVESINKDIKELQLDAIVAIRDKVSHDELMKIIQGSDVVLNVSYSEVNPNLVAESLVLNKKVIVTKESELSFIGFKNDLLYYIDPFDPKDISDKIIEAVSAFELEGVPHELEGLTWSLEQVIENHARIFERLIKQ